MKVKLRESRKTERPHISAPLMSVFAAYSRRFVRRNFHSIRILRSGLPACDSNRPLVIFLNHASWWDPLVALLLSRKFFATHRSFAPIDAAMLERYGVFRRLGFFGIEKNTLQGTRSFLQISRRILSFPRHALWITPQGRFMDVRERPLRFHEGLGALAEREPESSFIPLAIEYTFWTEPRPEILVAFGDPILPRHELERTAVEWTQILGEALEATQNQLAACSCRRDYDEWIFVNQGKSGVNAIYDSWQHFRARLRGEGFIADHQPEVRR